MTDDRDISCHGTVPKTSSNPLIESRFDIKAILAASLRFGDKNLSQQRLSI